MVRPCISKQQAIRAGLNDLATDQQMKIEDEFELIDNITWYNRHRFLGDEREDEAEVRRNRQAILSGFDPLRDQSFTLHEHMLAIEQLDPPLTHTERMDLQLYFSMIDDDIAEEWRYQQNMAWALHKGQWGDPQLAE